MTFDPTKPVQTRDGRKARIICTDADKQGNPIVALVRLAEEENEQVRLYNSDGAADCSARSLDLINIPEKRWVNVYDEFRSPYKTREGADAEAIDQLSHGYKRIACLEFTEGTGLND